MPSNPSGQDLHISRPLTNISVAYQQVPGAYVADQVFPQVPVQNQGDLYWKYNKGDWFRAVAGVRAPSTESPGAGWDVSTDSYFAFQYSVHKDIDDQIRANADNNFNLDRDATLWVTQNLLIKRDRIWVNKFLTTGVWGLDRTGVASAPTGNQFIQFNQAASDPINLIQNDILAMQGVTGLRPNTLVVGPNVLQVLSNHAGILDRIKYSERGIVTTDLLSSLFGVDRILPTQAIENIAPKGATDAMQYMNAKSMLLVYSAPNPSLLQPSGGYIFTWNGLLGAQAFGTRIKRFRMEEIASDRVEGDMAFDMKVVSPDVGYYYANAVA